MEEGQKRIARTAQAWEDWLAFMQVLGFCGLRASEVRALSWDDIDFSNDSITVRIARGASGDPSQRPRHGRYRFRTRHATL
jgi:integrase